MKKHFFTIPLDMEFGVDFAVKVNCGYTLEEIKKLLVQRIGYLDRNYTIRVGYLRFIWETIDVGTYEYPEKEPYGHYREFKEGGRGAMKVYFFEETEEAYKKRMDELDKEFEKWKEEYEG